MQHRTKSFSKLFNSYNGTSLTPLLEGWFMAMLDHFGPQDWWPAESPFEVAVGAILTQNTAWKNVEKALSNIRERGLLDPHALLRLKDEELARLIRPAGYYNIKSKRLKSFLEWLNGRTGGDIELLKEVETWKLREELLGIKGIGPETADSILLYALEKPVFVVDAYTIRALSRHDIIDQEAGYHQVQELFMDNLPVDAALFNEFHALFVALGKDHCRARRPVCNSCPVSEQE